MTGFPAFPLVVVSACFATSPAAAETLRLFPITNNSGVSPAVATQVQVDLIDQGPFVDVVVANNGGATGFVVTGFYIEDNLVLDSPGDETLFALLPPGWSIPASPDNLPDGGLVGFAATGSADADPVPTDNGIDISESATFRFTIEGGAEFQDVVNAFDSGASRVGLHIESIGTNGKSDSLVTPEPGSLSLLIGVGAVAMMRRRRLAWPGAQPTL